MILDVATRYLDCESSEIRDADTTEMNLRCFAGAVKVRRFYSDNDEALIAAARNLKWKYDFSKPHDPQSNGLIESHVGIVNVLSYIKRVCLQCAGRGLLSTFAK